MLGMFMRAREVVGHTKGKAPVYDYKDDRLRTLYKARADVLREATLADAIDAMETCLAATNPRA